VKLRNYEWRRRAPAEIKNAGCSGKSGRTSASGLAGSSRSLKRRYFVFVVDSPREALRMRRLAQQAPAGCFHPGGPEHSSSSYGEFVRARHDE
jgi:hypothetical protein